MLGVCMDITARKQDEGEMLRLRAELAHVGRVSTMAQLASGLAHELNQPLGAILRNAEAAELFLQSSPPDLEEVRAILADICRDDQRAGEVIDRMRALLKRRDLERVKLEVAELVDEVLVLVRPDAASRKVRLSVEVPATLPPVRGDRVHLQQVLLNLILNAMDAMAEVPPERRRLVVRARQADAAQRSRWRWPTPATVSPADELSRLFEPFFTTKPDGLGMGLPISAPSSERTAGGSGPKTTPPAATFSFTLPVGGEAMTRSLPRAHRLRRGRRRVVSHGRLAVAAGGGSSGEDLRLGFGVPREPAGHGPRLRRRGSADAGLERPGPAGGAGGKRAIRCRCSS